MTSKRPALGKVQCTLIRIIPDKQQICLEGHNWLLSWLKLYSLYILKTILRVYAKDVFGSRQSLRNTANVSNINCYISGILVRDESIKLSNLQ